MSITSAPSIGLTINGEARQVNAVSVAALLAALDYDGEFIAVAVNHNVIPRARWGEDLLREGDDIEIVSPRQGG